jgi:dipeptidyl-peptidase-4
MPVPVPVDAPTSYPRQRAQTRGFQLGRPRRITITDQRVIFLRSDAGTDPVGHLWSIDLVTGAERCLVRADSLPGLPTQAQLPAAELARRERMREVTAGITAFDVDRAGERIVFATNGVPYCLQVSTGRIDQLPSPGPVVDPRIAPNGHYVAYVCDRSLWCSPLPVTDNTEPIPEPHLMCQAQAPEQSWGLADFIGAEELDRSRGFWWASDSSGLLVEHVDNAPVDVVWISDPAQPEDEPQPHRYPAAGTDNARVQLWWVPVLESPGDEPQAIDLPLGSPGYEYLGSVDCMLIAPGTPAEGRASFLLTLFSRDQRSRATVQVWASPDNREQRWRVLEEIHDPAWVDVLPGVPAAIDRHTSPPLLIDIKVDPDTDTYRLSCARTWCTPPGLQVRAVVDVDPATGRITALASREPQEQHLIQVTLDATGTALVKEGHVDNTWVGAVARGPILVTSTSGLHDAGSAMQIWHQGDNHGLPEAALPGTELGTIASAAQLPPLAIRPMLRRVGQRALPTCLLLPTWWESGGPRLPVICSPYGGPHGQRVIAAAGAYSTEQWLADQGFAVLVADGRGTPGLGPAWERSVYLDLAEPVLNDQIDALHAVAAQNAALDLTRVGIRGWSFGGYLAALAVLARPDVFHAAVAGAPVTDWRWYDTAYTERYLKEPGAAQADGDPYERSSLIPLARSSERDKPDRPLLIIHGLADDNVLAKHTLQLSAALLAAGRAHQVLPLCGVTHMTPQEVVAENLLLLELQFFSENLHPPVAAD